MKGLLQCSSISVMTRGGHTYLWDLLRYNSTGETFQDGGLPNTRWSYELYRTSDLLVRIGVMHAVRTTGFDLVRRDRTATIIRIDSNCDRFNALWIVRRISRR